MIDEKKIEEVANKDSAFLYSEWNTPCKEAYVRGFKACMHWLRQNLWHDASEEPAHDKEIIVQHKGWYENIDYEVNMHYAPFSWQQTVEYDEIIKWCYIDDLLSEGGE